MHENLTFVIKYGPVDDFQNPPKPGNTLTIAAQRESSIRACVAAFEELLKSKVKGDEAVINWYQTTK